MLWLSKIKVFDVTVTGGKFEVYDSLIVSSVALFNLVWTGETMKSTRGRKASIAYSDSSIPSIWSGC